MVPTVPITPTRPVSVARKAARNPGSTTLMTGTATPLAQAVEPGGGRRVARHHDHLGVVLVHQLGRDLPGKDPNLVERAGTVGVTTGVADVDQVLLGQQVDERPGHRETAETAVEHADRTVIHCRVSLVGRSGGLRVCVLASAAPGGNPVTSTGKPPAPDPTCSVRVV